MLQKLGKWAWIGGGALACIAGMVNAIGYLSYSHQAVTHLTGTTSLLGIALQRRAFAEAAHLGGVMFAFFLGATLSGFITRRQTLKLGRRYGIALGIEGVFLALAALCMRQQMPAGAYFATFACGLQNAMASTYSGAILRTTHISGIVTDLGSALGHALRGMKIDGPRMRLYGLLLASFFLGGILGAAVFAVAGTDALLYPAGLVLVVALGYTGYAHYARIKGRV
jgi:Predicted membrane protein